MMSMRNEDHFVKHFAIIGSGVFLNILIGLITTPIITRIVSPDEYGKFSIFTMYTGIAVMVLCLGLDQAFVRYYYEQEETGYKRALLFNCIKVPVIVSIVFGILVVTFSFCGNLSFEFEPSVMVLLCINILVEVIYRFSYLLVRLSYQSKLYSTLNVLQKVFYIGIALFLILLKKNHYFLMLVLGMLLSRIICMIISIVTQKKIWLTRYDGGVVSTIPLKELLKYAYPYIFSMGITTLFQAVDKLSLNLYCSYKEVGVYASAMTIVNIFAIIQTTFNALWSPMSIEHYTKDKEDRSYYQKGNQIITVIMFFAGISLILCKDIFAILLGKKYREAAYILPFLIFNPIMYTISETTVGGLVFLKKSKLQIVVALGACITNIIGNAVLVPELGCCGAAISTGISYVVFFSLRTWFSNRYYYIDFCLRKFYLLTIIVSLYAFYNTFIPFNLGTVVGYLLCIVMMIILYKETLVFIFKYLTDMIKGQIRKM